MNDLVTIKGMLLASTEKAIGISISDENGEYKKKVEFWLPKSQIDRCQPKKTGEIGEIDIPRWLAEKNDLDYED
jgi:hypothetical protein